MRTEPMITSLFAREAADDGSPSAAAALAPATSKQTHALQIDGVGDRVPVFVPLLVTTTDTVPDDTSSAATLTVDGAHVVSTIDTIGDQDFYAVTLAAGVHYQIGMYGYAGGPSLTPLADAYVEIYDAAGNLVTSGDGGADTPLNATNSGFDVLLDFIPNVGGTYFVNARAFDNLPADGTDGDLVGDYELFVQIAPPGAYEPYYEVDEPLYALDWGSQVGKVNQSARNPDGDEGPRDTGNAQGTPVFGSALDIAGLAAAQNVDVAGKNVITIYFARAGDVFTSLEDPLSPGLPPATITAVGVQDFERSAVLTALAEFAKVADVVYLEVDDRDLADFVYTSYQGTPGPGVSLLGSMSPPGEANEGLAQFNSGDYRWNATDLQQGGFSFVTLIHEFGHGHGLAHPHDNGGRSGIMRGVEGEGAGVADYTTGDFALNQGVFTMMSYEDGWQSSPYGNAPTDVGYGYLGGLMAFDISAIQDKYGVNEDWATGDDTYLLKDVNAAGTFFASIWDAGGTDTIAYDGARDTVIDLRAATLAYETGGGGFVSYADGIFGGFTIANAVAIENARGGSGDDTLVGNALANRIDGGDGHDLIVPGAGSDTVFGGEGDDGFYFGGAFDPSDSADGGAGFDQVGLQGDYSGGLTLGAGSLAGVEMLVFLPGSDTRFGDTAGNLYSYDLAMHDANVDAGQIFRVSFNTLRAGENVDFDGSAETDGAFLTFGGGGNDVLTGGAGDDGFFFGTGLFGSGDVLNGGAGALDQLGLQGDYSDANAVVFGAGQLTGVEMIVCLSAEDARFNGNSGALYGYDLTMHDGNAAPGELLIVSANRLVAGETLVFDASAEADGGRYHVFSGAGHDMLIGGSGDDRLYGGAGGDSLIGGGGNDVFGYVSAAHSTAAVIDGIIDFTLGDRIDLAAIDAVAGGEDDAFAFIGAAAFTGAAGELRAALQSGNQWRVEADLDGDGTADFALLVYVTDGHPIGAGDFVL